MHISEDFLKEKKSSLTPSGWKSLSGWLKCPSQSSLLSGNLCEYTFTQVCVFVLQAALAVIIVVNLQAIMAQLKDVCVLWKADRLDLVSVQIYRVWHADFFLIVVAPFLQLVWVASLIFTLIFNLDLGLVVAVAFSLLTLLYRTQRSVNKIFDCTNISQRIKLARMKPTPGNYLCAICS